jgi:Mor family transcriptional regulator
MTDPARAPAPRHYEGTLADLLQSAIWALTDAGIAQTEADALACRVVDRMTAVLGGGCFYLPKNEVLRQMRRNLALWRAFDGTVHGAQGIRALARQFAMTEIHVYRIIKSQRAAHLAQYRPDLPGLADLCPETLTDVNSPSPAREAV